jgi:hypothetical protein
MTRKEREGRGEEKGKEGDEVRSSSSPINPESATGRRHKVDKA